MEDRIEKITFPNGLKLVYQPWVTGVSHFGVFIKVGSRDEEPHESGMAHFIEHTLFKGTQKRKAYHVINRLEGIGGELNAYTTKEETCLYASFTTDGNIARTVELFADILFRATFPEKEILKEKDIVIDEINSYLDSPSEYIFDEFEQLFYREHPLAGQILGSEKSLEGFNRDMLVRFVKKHYRPDNMVISYCGDTSFSNLLKSIEKFFPTSAPSDAPSTPVLRDLNPHFSGKTFRMSKNRSSYQTHCILGMSAPALDDSKRPVMTLLNNILGGPGLNSKLNMSLREKHAYTYMVESSYTPYEDQGLHTIYFGTDSRFLKKSLKLVDRELEKLASENAGTVQLHMSQKQILGQHAVSHDSGANKMMTAGKSLLMGQKLKLYDEIAEEIHAVTAADLRSLAEEIYKKDSFSSLIYTSDT